MAWQTPLIVRCWDAVADRAVVDDLILLLHPDGRPGRTIQGYPNPDGTFLFHGLPDLRAWELGEESTGTLAYWLTVADRSGRFLSATLAVSLPAEEPVMLYLFSATTRRFPGAVAELRADLWHEETGAPAAWAVLEATEADRTWYGIADGEGHVLLAFPYPRATGAGPPSWPVSLQIRTGAAPLAGVGPLALPPLDQILSQPVGQIRAAPEEAAAASLDVTLTMSGPLSLRTGSSSWLYVRSASGGEDPPPADPPGNGNGKGGKGK